MIRDVKLSDAKAISDIYNYYIQNTIITFEDENVDENEIAKRINKVLKKGYPFIVYETRGNVVGYAYVDNWRERAAYDITLETSIYLDHTYKGKRIGFILYKELIDRAQKISIHNLIGVISLPNPESIRLHQKLGFEKIGTFKKVGLKFNLLIDVDFWELNL